MHLFSLMIIFSYDCFLAASVANAGFDKKRSKDLSTVGGGSSGSQGIGGAGDLVFFWCLADLIVSDLSFAFSRNSSMDWPIFCNRVHSRSTYI